MFKKFIIFCLLIVLCLNFVACGEDDNADDGSNNQQTTKPTTKPSKPSADDIIDFEDDGSTVEDTDENPVWTFDYGDSYVAEMNSRQTTAQFNGQNKTISRVANNGGKYYIEVNGQPFNYIGASIRTDAFMNCDRYTYAEIDKLFEQAKLLNVTCVQIPLEWRDIEPTKDQFDFTYIDAMLTMCLKYGLKIEFLWYGTNMCGDSHSYSIPNYILEDGKTYPKLNAERPGEFWVYYGWMYFMEFDNDDLINREAFVINKCMEYIYDFDSTHGGTGILIGVQILNEPDIFFRYRINEKNVIDPTTNSKMSETRARNMVYKSLNKLGLAVKNSKYKVVTRVNFATACSGRTPTDVPDFVQAIYDLEGIDIIGDDTYTESWEMIRDVSTMMKKLNGNFPHFAENKGIYANTPELILTALSNGAGYSMYDLCTAPTFIAEAKAGEEKTIDHGIISVKKGERTQFNYTNHYNTTKSLLNGLKLAGTAVPLSAHGNFGGFTYSGQSQGLTAGTVRFDASSGTPYGFACYYNGTFYCYFTTNGTVTVKGAPKAYTAGQLLTVNG